MRYVENVLGRLVEGALLTSGDLGVVVVSFNPKGDAVKLIVVKGTGDFDLENLFLRLERTLLLLSIVLDRWVRVGLEGPCCEDEERLEDILRERGIVQDGGE